MERFTQTYTDLYQDVIKIIPDIKKDETKLPENNDSLYFFVENWYPHIEAASLCQEEYFDDKDVFLFPTVKFDVLIKQLNNINREFVWDYVHNLIALSYSIAETKNKYEVDNEEKDSTYAKVKEGYVKFPLVVTNIVSRRRIRSHPPPNPSPISEDFFQNSALGSLAREIGAEINPEEMLNMEELQNPANLLAAVTGQNQNSGLGRLMSAVVTKLSAKMESGEINQTQLFGEAQQVLASLSGGGSAPGPAGGMPDFSRFANMAQGMMSMGAMFGGGGGSDSNSRGGNRSSARAMRRRAARMDKQKKKNNPTHENQKKHYRKHKKKSTSNQSGSDGDPKPDVKED